MSLEIIEWDVFLNTPPDPKPVEYQSAMTVGVFDGVHLGHRLLVEMIVRRGPNPTVVTFKENPKKVVSPNSYEGDIFSLKQKLTAFERLGVSRVVLIDFSEKLSKLDGWEFFDLLEDRGKMAYLAIGANFRCGFQQKTDADFIRRMNEGKGIPTEVVSPVEAAAGSGPVSSSRIRSAIVSGDIRTAAALTGRNIELDLSDLQSAEIRSVEREKRKGLVYDFRSVQRIAPKAGQYPVLVYPGAVSCRADAENGKIFLPVEQDYPAERIEFIEE